MISALNIWRAGTVMQTRKAITQGLANHFTDGVTYLFTVANIQVCFSSSLPDLAFSDSFFHFQKIKSIFFLLQL